MLCARRIEGNYPNYKAVIPTSYNMTAKILVSDLMDSARRVSMASPTDSNLLKLTMRGATLEISSEDVMVNKRAKETHLCEVVGGDLQIGVSSQMLANCLSVIESEYVTMRFTDATRPIVYIDEANENKIALSMPMRVE
jgi:DNA polymerase-3 subunit beta